MHHPLELAVLQIPEEGIHLDADLTPSQLDLPEEQRIEPVGVAHVALKVERRHQDITVRGTARLTLRCRCDRCLEEFEQPHEVADICHFFADVHDDWINLTTTVREDILLVYPDRLLCRQGCQGLCPICGLNRNREPCSCGTSSETPESVWDALNTLELPAAESSADSHDSTDNGG